MSWNKKISKFWILLLSSYQKDSQGAFEIALRYTSILFLFFIYRFLFTVISVQKKIQLDSNFISYPLFLVSGLMTMCIINLAMRVVDITLSDLKRSDMMEWVVISRSSFWELFAANSAWYFFLSLTEVSGYLVFGHLFLGTPVRPFLNPLCLFVALILFITYMGIGALISSLILIFQRGKSFITAFYQFSTVFGGVFFPIEIFPRFLKTIAECMPLTRCLKLIRSLIIGIHTDDAIAQMGCLSLIAIIILMLSMIIFKKSLDYAKKNDLLFDEKQ